MKGKDRNDSAFAALVKKQKRLQMQTQKRYVFESGGSPLSSIGAVILLVLFFVALFFIARGIFTLLAYLSPVLLIITLVLDYQVVTSYLKWVFQLVRQNPLAGIGMILLTVLGFPVVVGFLFGKALLKRKIKQVQRNFETRQRGELVEYEEIESRPAEKIELPPMPLPRQKEPEKNPYDDLLDEKKS